MIHCGRKLFLFFRKAMASYKAFMALRCCSQKHQTTPITLGQEWNARSGQKKEKRKKMNNNLYDGKITFLDNFIFLRIILSNGTISFATAGNLRLCFLFSYKWDQCYNKNYNFVLWGEIPKGHFLFCWRRKNNVRVCPESLWERDQEAIWLTSFSPQIT